MSEPFNSEYRPNAPLMTFHLWLSISTRVLSLRSDALFGKFFLMKVEKGSHKYSMVECLLLVDVELIWAADAAGTPPVELRKALCSLR